MTDINRNDGDKVIHSDNYFIRMNLDNKDLMCGLVTPFNGFITTCMTVLTDTVLACSVNYLGQVVYLIENEPKESNSFTLKVFDSIRLSNSYQY